MGVKKTWFSYFSACAGICFTGYLLFTLLFNETELWNSLAGLFPFPFEELLYRSLFIALFLIAFLGLVLGISFIKKNISLKEYSEAPFFKVLSIILFVLLICYQIFLNYNEIFTVSGDLKEYIAADKLEIINRAFIGEDFKITDLDSLYIFLISFMLRIFGENYIVVPLFNAFLEILLLVFLYFTLKPTFGSVVSIAGTVGITAFSYLFDSFEITSDRFGLALFLFVTMIVMNIVYAYGNEGEDEEKIRSFASFKILYLSMLYLLTFLFYTCLYFFKYKSFNLCLYDISRIFDAVNIGFVFYIVLLLLILNVYISMFFEKEDHISGLTLIMIVSSYFVINNDFYKYSGEILLLSMILLATSGAMALLFRGYKEPDYGSIFDSEELIKEEPLNEDLIEEEAYVEDSVEEEPTEETVVEVEDTIEVLEEIPEPVSKPKVQLIENPLPGPKPHVKKNLDYGFEPSEGEMKYDYDVKDDDDFDI